RSYGEEELIDNLFGARTLCQAFNDEATLVSVLVGLGRSCRMRADREARERLADEELRLLSHVHEPTLAIQLHTQLVTDNVFRAAYGKAQEHYARVLELHDPQRSRELALLFGGHPVVAASILSGWSLWMTGQPDQARSRMQQGLTWALELGHPFSLCLALVD